MLYPKDQMKTALATRPDLYPIIFAHRQSLTGEHLIQEGRVYGGGLHKMEPKELASLPANEVARIIPGEPPVKQRYLAI
jgi:adenine-specific DNA-methyltransferase